MWKSPTRSARFSTRSFRGIGKTTDLVSEIAAASQEQAQVIDQVNTAIAQMDKVTQQNAANAEESASALRGTQLAGRIDE